MADSKTFSNFKDAIFTMAVIGGIVGGIKMYSDIGKLEDTNERFKAAEKKRSKQWAQIGNLKNQITALSKEVAFEKGLRIGKESSCRKGK